MAVTAHFGETIHYNAFTDVTSITDATRDDLEEKGFNITVGAYPIIANAIVVSGTQTVIPNITKWNPDVQTITLPTLDEFIRTAKKYVAEIPDTYTYMVVMSFKTTYINPSDSTDAILREIVQIEVEVGS